ncbi:pyridoxal phosphate-dependent aminotransferase family protein [Cytophagaceae bacterium DM2B3-1]|uniref:Pyridoxal phosphate-dependent aminotransferase family protein n=1 Tax=Xanthocytophaga flava TaxID=3048013 RepID=A0AAE3UDW6_9BACT|nr:pyridoxal phosphate-dependent aminotransferase family protein [Xanthocytophaga flavus]MDJ1473264.1 pyridoxal phosphate-dependent aminotransferase family protein [Xanthocytophaga flavus]MDJ1486184.1 pyridoxal phosphate-dependent aminotransferase family protein [Xanthocytophaga flavus]MDJ1497680.1 pyridoxal phosphate-dependent aminotransferase family protein [Xanthocytophaga flavus]
MDIFEKRIANPGNIGKHSDNSHGYFTFPKLEGEIGPHMKFRGKTLLNWSLNNYLGLANHPEVRKADAEAAAQYGLALPMGARMMSGNSVYHEQLERELAEFVKKDDSILLNYGYQGIMSVIDALTDRHDIIVYDAEAHACIIDGIRMHIGQTYKYLHNNIADLEKNLQRAVKKQQESGNLGGILVITEGVFGMTGAMGKLKEIVELKKKYDFRLLVDDAHGFGTMGATGAGVGEAQGVQEDIDLYFSTFAKSMAGFGAFVAGKKDILMYLRYNLRSQIYAKSLPMAMVIGALKRMELLRTQPELRENLWKVVNALQNGLREHGYNIGTTESPVTPVMLNGTIPESQNMVIDLRENHGVFCSVVVYPVVPKDMILLRLIPTASHTLEDVEKTLVAFDKISDKLRSGVYASTEVPMMVNV